jgi:hypothetical protein
MNVLDNLKMKKMKPLLLEVESAVTYRNHNKSNLDEAVHKLSHVLECQLVVHHTCVQISQMQLVSVTCISTKFLKKHVIFKCLKK